MSLSDHSILTFDVIGTLIDFETGVLDYLRPIAESDGRTASERAILEAFARAEARQHREAPRLPFTQMLAPIYEDLAVALALPSADGEAEGFRASIPDWPAFPDSVAALARLAKGRRLVALTNADNWALEQMARTLGDPFDDRVTAEDVGVNKPDPQVFAYCRGRQSVSGYRLADFLHVAQSQYHDIGVAKRLGFTVCWIERRQGRKGAGATPRTEEVTEPDHHFASLAELADAVEAAVEAKGDSEG